MNYPKLRAFCNDIELTSVVNTTINMLNLTELADRVEKSSKRNSEDRDALTWLQYELKAIVADTTKISQYEIAYCKTLLEKVDKALDRSK